jgi:hypothetical protein
VEGNFENVKAMGRRILAAPINNHSEAKFPKNNKIAATK